MSHEDLSQTSMIDLFRMEAENQAQVLITGLLALERDPVAADQLEACMRAAHSLKGAARIVGISVGVTVAHAMEDCFVAAQTKTIILRKHQIDELLRGVDLMKRIAQTPDQHIGRWDNEKAGEIDAFVSTLSEVLKSDEKLGEKPDENPGETSETTEALDRVAAADEMHALQAPEAHEAAPARHGMETTDRVLRVTAQNLNRLLGLAGESLVDSRGLKPFNASMLQLKRLHYDLNRKLDELRDSLSGRELNEQEQTALADIQHHALDCQRQLGERLVELEMFDRRSANLSHRLYEAALACQMRPFADGVRAFPRVVRDLSHSLGKHARLEIVGKATLVDRDMLEQLDAPLGHLLRNAVDHGIESAQERKAAGKHAEGVVHLEAYHSGGLLQIVVADDGAGIDCDKLRDAIIQRKLAKAETAARLSESELLEFLFLPGFTMKDTVTEVSGRGVGLDVVQNMLKQVRGTVRVSSQPGQGTRFQMQLPLTLSVVRTLLVDVGGEPYAFPLAYIVRTVKLPREQIGLIEGRQHFDFDGLHVGLVTAHQVLGFEQPELVDEELSVVVIGESGNLYGLVVDHLLGERELVIQALDPLLGKIKDISAGALMEDGSPVLIVDVEDIVRSVDKLISTGHLSGVKRGHDAGEQKKRKRVLVVDDSLTVRELERKLLVNNGYEVEVAVDGRDGWNSVRTGNFNLIVTDVDMPRMDGIELVTLIKNDPRVKSLPVMIVSYKDRAEDRRRGLDAGADYYLAKGSFHDDALLQAVVDLIGEG